MILQNSIPPSDPKPCRALLAGVAVMLGVMLASPVAAQTATCTATGPASLKVATDLPPPVYRHRLTRSQIGALEGRGHMTSDQRHAGLTQTWTAFTINPNVESRQVSKGVICVSVRQVEVSWRMAQFLVDIAAEYRQGSCPYGEILRHENQHVAISQTAFTTADRTLRQQLAEAVRRQPAFLLRATPQQAAQHVADQLMAVARPILEQYNSDTRRQNAAIDTQESYRAVSARCRDW